MATDIFPEIDIPVISIIRNCGGLPAQEMGQRVAAQTERSLTTTEVAIGQTQVRQLPPGMTPPLIIKYSASSIPVVQLGLSSPTLPEQTVFDAAVNTLRPQLVTITGVAVPFRTAARTASSRSTSTCRHCRRAASRRPTWSTPSTCRT